MLIEGQIMQAVIVRPADDDTNELRCRKVCLSAAASENIAAVKGFVALPRSSSS
jgi:hypothetical protein